MLDLTPAAPPLPPPSRFLREETIVEGEFATTYRARDLIAGRPVTLTQVSADQAADAFFVARLEREARLLASIDHPNVVRLVTSGVEQGVPFVACEHVPGRTLAEVIETRGALTVGDATTMARQILAGLGAIHAAGLLHLRLTPKNILLGDDGVARIAGVGIAGLGAAGDRTDRSAGIDETRYLAPELIEGGDVCEATDLYAAGGILFEALTGQPPFPGQNPVLVRFAQLQAPPPVPSQIAMTGIPPALDSVVVRALAKRPDQRFASAEQMAAALARDFVTVEVDHVLAHTAAGAVSVPLAKVETPLFAPPVDVFAPPDGSIPPCLRRRQESTGWLWPLVVAVTAIALLIGALTVSLSGEMSVDEMVAGVSTFAADPTKNPENTARPAQTPTARVIRTSNTVAEPTAKKKPKRTPAATDEE